MERVSIEEEEGRAGEEEIALRTQEKKPRQSALWRFFGKRLPRCEIVFLCQIIIIYTVIGVSLFNLTSKNGFSNLWVALLSSCLGYLLPNPRIRGEST